MRFAVTVILARLLTPEQFGVVAMMTAVFAIATVFQELGLSQATVQRTDVSAHAISTLFWINSAAGAVLTLVFAGFSHWIAAFYSRPELVLLCSITSITFLLNGIAVQHQALLQRQMRFSAQAWINLVPPLVGGTAALLIAWQGGGIWSLAVQIIVTDAVTLALLLRATKIVLVRPALTDEVRDLVRFGISLFGFSLLYGVALNLYVVLLGRTAGAAAAGLYSRAMALVAIPQSFVYMSAGYVALPKLSKLKDSEFEFARFYYQSVQLVSLINAPIIVFFVLFAETIALCVYGEQWGEVAGLIRIFALGLATAPLIHGTSQVFVARGQSDRLFKWGVVSAGVMCATAMAGSRWGLEGIAWGWSASGVILLVPSMLYAFKGSQLSIRGVIAASANAYGAAAGLIPAGLLVKALLDGYSIWVELTFGLVFCMAVYLSLAYFVFRQAALMDSVFIRLFRSGRPRAA